MFFFFFCFGFVNAWLLSFKITTNAICQKDWLQIATFICFTRIVYYLYINTFPGSSTVIPCKEKLSLRDPGGQPRCKFCVRWRKQWGETIVMIFFWTTALFQNCTKRFLQNFFLFFINFHLFYFAYCFILKSICRGWLLWDRSIFNERMHK